MLTRLMTLMGSAAVLLVGTTSVIADDGKVTYSFTNSTPATIYVCTGVPQMGEYYSDLSSICGRGVIEVGAGETKKSNPIMKELAPENIDYYYCCIQPVKGCSYKMLERVKFDSDQTKYTIDGSPSCNK